jgi:hypothetical protein
VAAGGAVVVILPVWVSGHHYVALNVGVENMIN